MIQAPRALNAGAILVMLALLLAFAAGTLGLGPDKPVRHGYFEPDFFRSHGGAIGESLYWASTSLFQRLGAQILAVLMLLSGLLLLTGMTIANLVQSAGVATRRASGATADVARAARRTAASRRRFRAGTSRTTWISRSPARTRRRCSRTSRCGRSPRTRKSPSPRRKPASGEGAFSYDEAHGDEEQEPAPEPVAILGEGDADAERSRSPSS